MSILWNRVSNEVALLLGALDAYDIGTAQTQYNATQSTSTLRGADYPPQAIQDACINAAMQIAQAICESNAHPEITTFRVVSAGVTHGASVPTTSSSGTGSLPRVGPIRAVYDSSNSYFLTETTPQRVADWKRQGAGTFGAYTPYLYAIDGGTLLHTRTQVICEFCGLNRGVITANIGGTDIVPLNDEHEPYIVWGATAELAGKETMFMELAQQCDAKFQQHLSNLRSYPGVSIDVSGAAPGK